MDNDKIITAGNRDKKANSVGMGAITGELNMRNSR